VLAALRGKTDPTSGVASGTEKTIADRHKTRVVRFTADASSLCGALQVAMREYSGGGWPRGWVETAGSGQAGDGSPRGCDLDFAMAANVSGTHDRIARLSHRPWGGPCPDGPSPKHVRTDSQCTKYGIGESRVSGNRFIRR